LGAFELSLLPRAELAVLLLLLEQAPALVLELLGAGAARVRLGRVRAFLCLLSRSLRFCDGAAELLELLRAQGFLFVLETLGERLQGLGGVLEVFALQGVAGLRRRGCRGERFAPLPELLTEVSSAVLPHLVGQGGELDEGLLSLLAVSQCVNERQELLS